MIQNANERANSAYVSRSLRTDRSKRSARVRMASYASLRNLNAHSPSLAHDDIASILLFLRTKH